MADPSFGEAFNRMLLGEQQYEENQKRIKAINEERQRRAERDIMLQSIATLFWLFLTLAAIFCIGLGCYVAWVRLT